MNAFQISTKIDAPVERVWGVMIDVERWHEWTPSITGIQRLDDGPLVPGSRALVRQPRLPRATWTVTRVNAFRGFTWESAGPGFRTVGHHEVQPDGSGSIATLSLEYRGPLGALVVRLTRRIIQRYVSMEAEGLKRRSEDPEFSLQSRSAVSGE